MSTSPTAARLLLLANLGPLAPLFDDPKVTEIMVVGPEDVYVEVDGKLELTAIRFESEEALLRVIRLLVESVGRRVDEQNPLCDARMSDGSRIHVAVPPIAVDGPQLNIRRFVQGPLDAEDLVRFGSCSTAALGFLKACVMARANILFSGGTGSGKTTLLNVLSGFIPGSERIVTIEDAAELHLQQRHVARLESRPVASELGEVTIRDLVKTSLRMRPDRIIVGEIRGAEALDMLQAMNTGHDGSMTTLHANKPRDALARLETLILMAGYDVPIRSIRAQIASALNVIVHTERERDGSRKVALISEIAGMEEDVVTMQDVFRFVSSGYDAAGRVTGKFVAGSFRPRILDRLAERSIEMPPEIAALYPYAAA